MKLYQNIMNKNLLARRITITANNVVDEETATKEIPYEQIDLFTNYQEKMEKKKRRTRRKRITKSDVNDKKEIWKKCYIKRNELTRRRNHKRKKWSDRRS